MSKRTLCNQTYTYIINRRGSNEYKIGQSIKPEKRLKQLQTGNGQSLKIIGCFYTDKYLEKRLHKMFMFDRKVGEWFVLSEEKLDMILTYLEQRYPQYTLPL